MTKITKTQKIINMLENAGDAGLSINDLKNSLNTSSARIYGLIHNIRNTKHKIVELIGDKYILKINNLADNTVDVETEATKKLTSKQYQLFAYLCKHTENGASVKMIQDELHFTACMIYSTIKAIKAKGYNIISRNSKYFISSANELVVSPAQQLQSQRNQSSHIKSSMKALFKESKEMTLSDQADFDDLMKKSIFYNLSAEALVRANQAVTQMRNEVL